MIYKKDVIPSETFLKEQVLLKGTWKMISFTQESGQKCFALGEWHEGDAKIESHKNSGYVHVNRYNFSQSDRLEKSCFLNMIS